MDRVHRAQGHTGPAAYALFLCDLVVHDPRENTVDWTIRLTPSTGDAVGTDLIGHFAHPPMFCISKDSREQHSRDPAAFSLYPWVGDESNI